MYNCYKDKNFPRPCLTLAAFFSADGFEMMVIMKPSGSQAAGTFYIHIREETSSTKSNKFRGHSVNGLMFVSGISISGVCYYDQSCF